MSTINISDSLSEKLGEDRKKQIDGLTMFQENLEAFLASDKCDDLMRENITKKMQTIAETLVVISRTVNARHMAEDTKVSSVGNILDGIDLKSLRNELVAEIQGTEKSLLDKARQAALESKNSIQQSAKDAIKFIDDNIQSLKEALKSAKGKEAKLRRETAETEKDDGQQSAPETTDLFMEESIPDEVNKENEVKQRVDHAGETHESHKAETAVEKKNRLKKTYKKVENKHEKALVAYKQHGFVEIFKRLWNENKVVQDNKKNIFVIAKNALSEVYSKGNREVRSDIKDKAEELYEKQKKIADKIKKLEKDIKNSKQQKKEVIQTFSSIGESVLSSAKTKANKAVEPIPSSQITYERTFGVIDKISKFSKKELGRWKDEITQSISDVFDNMRDSRLEKIEDRIVQKISDLEGDIDILDDDIQVLMEERDNAFRSYIRADKESEPEFYIENKAKRKVIKGIHKLQEKFAKSKIKRKSIKLDKKKDALRKQEDKYRKTSSRRSNIGQER